MAEKMRGGKKSHTKPATNIAAMAGRTDPPSHRRRRLAMALAPSCAMLCLATLGGPMAARAFVPPGPRRAPPVPSLEASAAVPAPPPASAAGGGGASGGPPAIAIDSLTCTHDGGTTYQLRDVSYFLGRGAKAGLVGRNGCGKSTLLKILAEATGATLGAGGGSGRGGKAFADDGVVYRGTVKKAKGAVVAYVEQEPPMSSDVTVADALLGFSSGKGGGLDGGGGDGPDGAKDVYGALRLYRTAVSRSAEEPERFAEASERMDELDGWKALARLDEVATSLRVKHLEGQTLATLSGGERKRVALAAALAREPEVLLLDEPTNHLDLAAIRWLSDLIKAERKLSVLVVTHDRAFLDDICDSILELDGGGLYSYSAAGDQGGYQAYLEGKAARMAAEDSALAASKNKYRVELDWMRRQPQARETKQKARQDAFYKLEKAAKPRPAALDLELGTQEGERRIGTTVLKLRNASLRFGDRVLLDDFTYDFNRGDKLGIVGSNGVGKSTFIRMLAGEQAVDSGEIVTGETVVFGVYDQMGIEIEDEDQRLMDYVKEKVEANDGRSLAEAPQEAMKLLKRFQFSRQRWNERIALLSGGERRRLQLLTVLTRRPNFLVLDEPSNDLDLDTLAALEGYLAEYNGVLVVVSHDRFFVDKVTDHLFVFEGEGAVKDYTGTLTDYSEALTELEKNADGGGKGAASTPSAGGGGGVDARRADYREDKEARVARRNATRKLRREMDNLEPAIERLKAEAAEVQEEIDGTPAEEGWTVLAELTDRMNGLSERAEEKEMRWLELAEELEAMEGGAEE
jgi:ATP-binding cassette subfamily F protein uup